MLEKFLKKTLKRVFYGKIKKLFINVYYKFTTMVFALPCVHVCVFVCPRHCQC